MLLRSAFHGSAVQIVKESFKRGNLMISFFIHGGWGVFVFIAICLIIAQFIGDVQDKIKRRRKK